MTNKSSASSIRDTSLNENKPYTAEDVHRLLAASHETMHAFMKMSAVGFFEYTPNGTLIRANDSWYAQSLYPRETPEHDAFTFMDLVHSQDAAMVMQQWNRLASGHPVAFEMRWKASSSSLNTRGEALWIFAACVPVFNDQIELVRVAGNTIDISGLKAAQIEALARAEKLEKIRLREHQLARFAEVAPVACYLFDTCKGMVYCNRQFFELTGHPTVEPKDINWDQLIYPDDLSLIDSHWQEVLNTRKPCQTQFRLLKRWENIDSISRQAWAQGTSYPECNAAGDILTVFGMLIDITRFKWAEDFQLSRVEEVLEAKRQQENFIDMTSHEMRNPLSAVVQCADSALDSIRHIEAIVSHSNMKQDEENTKTVAQEIGVCIDALQTIIACSMHQKRVIDDILTLSKLDSNLLAITPIRVRPASIIADALKMFDIECMKEDIDLRFQEDSSISELGAEWVMLDPSRVLQVLINLLTNAIKFSRGRSNKNVLVRLGAMNSRPAEDWEGITFAATRTMTDNATTAAMGWGTGEDAYIWITVQDTGCGMTTEEQSKLFTRFGQASPRTHVKYGGTGLGLFISKSLTELQNGCIGVNSEANKGSTFAFYVSVRIASNPNLDALSTPEHQLASSITRLTKRRSSLTTLTILLVEDNLVNQRVLSQQLHKAGITVHVAGHGLEALEFLKTSCYWHSRTETGEPLSIVLMDVEMPIMDGLACARQIRMMEQAGLIAGHVPILAVSANARNEQVGQALDSGMDDAITKPFRMPELMQKIKKLTQK